MISPVQESNATNVKKNNSMKVKIIFITLFFSIFLNAQINIIQEFDPLNMDTLGWHADIYGSAGLWYISNPEGSTPCQGTHNMVFQYNYGEQTIGNYVDLYVLASERSQISDGKEITIKFYPLQFGEGTTDYETYYTVDNGISWIKIEQNGASGNSPNICSQVIIKLPAGTIPMGNTTFGFKFRNIKTSLEHIYGMVDYIVISQNENTLLNNELYKNKLIVSPTIITDSIIINNYMDIEKITIVDTSGKIIKNLKKFSEKIYLSDLQTGIYYFIINMKNNELINQKIIKK